MKSNYDLNVMCGYYEQPIDGEWDEYVTAYHITRVENVPSILTNGLIAKECRATRYGDARSSAVYLLAAKCDAYDEQIRKFLFGATDGLAVIKVTIPTSMCTALREDGIFNVSCICADGSYPTAMQYTDNIPASWLKKI